MSKLLESTEDEYRVIRNFIDSIQGVEIEGNPPLQRFAQEIKDDLIGIMSKHNDYNNLKKKYYMCRKNQR